MPCLLYLVTPDLEPCIVRETAPSRDYDFRATPGLQDYTDLELSHVRLVLRKVISLRIRNEEDAEDLVQETFLTMTAKCRGEELKKGLLIWSMGILRKKIGNYYRRARRYTGLDEQTLHTSRPAQQYCHIPSPEAKMRYVELVRLINSILVEFPLQERQPVEMALTGMPTGEIAQNLFPERYQNVLNHLYRGRRRLARELAKYGYSQVWQD